MRLQLALGIFLGLYYCIYAEPNRNFHLQNEVWSFEQRQHRFGSECDPGWTCVAQHDCHGAIRPWYYPKSRCGPGHSLVCCGPTSAAAPVAAMRKTNLKTSGTLTQAADETKTMSRSERACNEYLQLFFWVRSVVGGKKAKIHDFPYMVAIGYSRKGRKTDNLSWNCGGTIISNEYVLTAAHCITDARERGLEPSVLRAGSSLVPERGLRVPTDYAVAGVTLHPGNRPPRRSHDLALLRVSPPFNFSAAVRPACLPASTVPEEIPKSLWAAGWGATDKFGFEKSTQLKKAKLDVIPLDECKKQFDKAVPEELDETIICAAHPTRASDTCAGDSGGPLVALYEGPPGRGRPVVVAVTSFGGWPCAGPHPGVYSRTAPALRWIESVVWPSR